jgi:hypothetical protein
VVKVGLGIFSLGFWIFQPAHQEFKLYLPDDKRIGSRTYPAGIFYPRIDYKIKKAV